MMQQVKKAELNNDINYMIEDRCVIRWLISKIEGGQNVSKRHDN